MVTSAPKNRHIDLKFSLIFYLKKNISLSQCIRMYDLYLVKCSSFK